MNFLNVNSLATSLENKLKYATNKTISEKAFIQRLESLRLIDYQEIIQHSITKYADRLVSHILSVEEWSIYVTGPNQGDIGSFETILSSQEPFSAEFNITVPKWISVVVDVEIDLRESLKSLRQFADPILSDETVCDYLRYLLEDKVGALLQVKHFPAQELEDLREIVESDYAKVEMKYDLGTELAQDSWDINLKAYKFEVHSIKNASKYYLSVQNTLRVDLSVIYDTI